MKKLVLALALSALTGSAFAAHTGTYVGLGLGASRLDTPSYDVNVPGVSYSEKRGGLGERAFVGYNFNRNFGAELSLNNFAQSKYKVNAGDAGSAQAKYSMYALELVGKAYLPLENSFNLYGLAGAAYVHNQLKYSEDTDFTSLNDSATVTTRRIRPVVGLGASYDVNSNVTTSLEFSRIVGQGNVKTNDKAIPNADMLSFNVSYNFE